MFKILKILLINLLLLFCIFMAIEFSIYFISLSANNKDISFALQHQPFKYAFKNGYVHRLDISNYFTGEDNVNFGRLPEGIEYSGIPIIIFGCSFAHGQYLDKSETLSAKLSKALKRPVYNRAVPGQGLQEMYYQSTRSEFYDAIKDSDTVLYIMINDQYRRIYLDYLNITDQFVMLGYERKNDNLVLKDYSNPFMNLYRSLYLVRYLTKSYIDKILFLREYRNKITDDALLYFEKTRDELEKHYNHKVRFIVLFYEDDQYQGLLRDKLKAKGFFTANANELTQKNLMSHEYLQENKHPKAIVWDMLLEPIIKTFFE